MHHRPSSNGTAALAFIAGISAGVAAGILWAPRRGSETRQQLRAKVQEAKGTAMERVGDQAEKVKEAVATVTARGEHLAQGVQENIEDRSKEIAQTAAKAGQKAANDTKHATRGL